jgi:hypothetical protein
MADLTLLIQKAGYDGLYLTTDSEGNDSTNSFYLRSGFLKKNSYFQGKRKMNVYFRDLTKS